VRRQDRGVVANSDAQRVVATPFQNGRDGSDYPFDQLVFVVHA
jgi:hypothetical protein